MRQLNRVFDQMTQHRMDRTAARKDRKDQFDNRLRLLIRIFDHLA